MLDWHRSLLTNIELLTPQECAAVYAALKDLRPHWIRRHATVPFYTLGAANYYDIANNPELPYYDIARRLNPVLLERLDWLYSRLAEALSEAFGVPARYGGRRAVPGFNILFSHPALENPQTLMVGEWFEKRYDRTAFSVPIHCDTPHFVVDWSDAREIDMDRPLSFTVPIAMPQSGAALRVWDLWLDEAYGKSEAELHEQLQTRRLTVHDYELGHCALHTGLRCHTIAAVRDVQPEDARITLQGHGLLADGAIQLYW